MSGIGKRFKLERESKHLNLEEIAQETRIGVRFLRAIEEEAFHVLPGGIFNRGFIRTYASRLGIDPEQSVAEYKALVKEADVDETVLLNVSPETPERHVLPIAVGCLVVLVVLFYVFAREPGMPRGAPARSIATTEATAITGPAPTPQYAPETPAPVIRLSPVTTPDPRTTQAEMPNYATGVDVRINVLNDTWVSVQSDGEAVVEGVILGAGTTRRYSASEALELTIGNAAGLTLSINGREVPTLGGDGQVRVLTITPNNVEQFTGS